MSVFMQYTKFARSKGWVVDVVDVSRSDAGGLKEGVLGIKGDEAFERLQWESGVHRVQRIPVNDIKVVTYVELDFVLCIF